MKRFIPAVLSAALLLSTCAFANSASSSALNQAYQDSLMNTTIARVAMQRGTSSQVKQLAQRLLNDQSTIQQQLKADAQGAKLPSQLDSAHQSLLDDVNGNHQTPNDALLRAMREGTAWEYSDLSQCAPNSQLNKSLSSLGSALQQEEGLLGRVSG